MESAAPAARTGLVVVDVQGTFADDVAGAGLPVPGSGATVDPIRQFTERAATAPGVVAVVTSQDWHPEHLPGHIAEPGETPDAAAGIFPRHGTAGTAQAELHPRLATASLLGVLTARVRKGQRAAAFSAFEGTDEAGRTLAELLDDAGATRLVVYGWELANCVRATALDGVRLGYEVHVVAELCSVLDPGREHETLASLVSGGVHVIATADDALALLGLGGPAAGGP